MSGLQPLPPARLAPEQAGEGAYDWRRMHPVTPLLKGWKIVVAVMAIAFAQAGDDIAQAAELLDGKGWLVALGGLVAIAVIGVLWSLVSWRATRFAVTDEAVHLRQGVVFKQQRQARLDRLQAVDMVQPLLARLVGLAELRLEVAGGQNSRVSLSFLREAEATALRAELLALAAGIRRPQVQAAAQGPGGDPTDPAQAVAAADGAPAASSGPAPLGVPAFETAPERVVYEVPMPRLIGSIVRSTSLLWIVAGVVGLAVALTVGAPAEVMFSVIPAMFALVSWLWTRLNTGATFCAATSPDGIRLRHGLTEARSQTVPPGRIQAVRMVRPLLWSRKDWWYVQVNIAGYAGDNRNQASETVLHPVATRAEAMTALWLVLPDLGVDDPVAAIDAGLDGFGEDGGYTAAPPSSRWVDPIGWRRHGVLVTRQALLVRSGRLRRSFVVVPHERTQSLGLEQGPLQRKFGLASVVAHSTPGPVAPRVEHLDQHVAARLLDEQAARARHARREAGPEQWMRDR